MSDDYDLWFDVEGCPIRESLPLEQVGPRYYRLWEFPVWTDAARFGDLIEAEHWDDGSLHFRRVVEPSAYRTFDWLVTRTMADSQQLARLCQAVTEQGGHWVRDFGGVLHLALPPAAALDLDAELNELNALANQGRLTPRSDTVPTEFTLGADH